MLICLKDLAVKYIHSVLLYLKPKYPYVAAWQILSRDYLGILILYLVASVLNQRDLALQGSRLIFELREVYQRKESWKAHQAGTSAQMVFC